MKSIKRKEQIRTNKSAKGFKLQSNVRAGVGYNNRDTYGTPYGTF